MSAPNSPAIANVLAPFATLAQEVEQLVSRYGRDAVIRQVKWQTKAKTGRPEDQDWPLLIPFIELDVRDWLDGRDPVKRQTHNAIAESIAKENPEVKCQPSSQAKRLRGKLKTHRWQMSLLMAVNESWSDHPHPIYLRLVETLVEGNPAWSNLHLDAQANLVRFRQEHGEPPAQMSMAAIEETVVEGLRGIGSDLENGFG